MKTIVATLLLWSSFLAVGLAQQDADNRYLVIYGEVQQADSLLSNGQLADALTAYQTAQAQLLYFQQIYPNWDTDIVSYRLNDLADKIASLRAQIPATNSPAASANAPSNAPPAAAATVAPVASAAPPAASNNQSAAEAVLQRQLQSLKDDNTQLQAKLREALSAQPNMVEASTLAKANDQIRDLMKENALLRASQSTTPPSSTNIQLGGLQSQLDDSEKKQADQEIQIAKLTDQNRALQASLDNSGKQSMDLFNRLQAENQELQAKLAAMQNAASQNAAQTAAAASQSSAQLTTATGEMDKLKMAVEIATLEKTALEDRLKRLAAETVASDQRFQVTINELTAQRDELQAERDNFKSQRDELQTQRDQLKQQMDDMSQKLQAAAAAVPAAPVQTPTVTNQAPPVAQEQNPSTTESNPAPATAMEASTATAPASSAEAPATPVVAAQAPPASTPPAEAPVVQTPVVQTPVVQTPVVQTPVVQTPVVQTPVVEAPASTPAPAAASEPEKLPPGSADLVASAQQHFSNHQYDLAEADYRKILQLDPGNGLVLANLAAIELEENKLDDANRDITAALVKSPDDAYNLAMRGKIEFAREDYLDAYQDLNHAAQLDPNNPETQNYLGLTLQHLGRSDAAEAALIKAIQLDPNYAPAHNNLAVIYMAEDPPLPQLARWHYEKAIAAGQPRNPDLERLLAQKGATVSTGQ